MSRAVQLVLLSVVILTCLQTGVAHDNDDGKSLLRQQYIHVMSQLILCFCSCQYDKCSSSSDTTAYPERD